MQENLNQTCSGVCNSVDFCWQEICRTKSECSCICRSSGCWIPCWARNSSVTGVLTSTLAALVAAISTGAVCTWSMLLSVNDSCVCSKPAILRPWLCHCKGLVSDWSCFSCCNKMRDFCVWVGCLAGCTNKLFEVVNTDVPVWIGVLVLYGLVPQATLAFAKFTRSNESSPKLSSCKPRMSDSALTDEGPLSCPSNRSGWMEFSEPIKFEKSKTQANRLHISHQEIMVITGQTTWVYKLDCPDFCTSPCHSTTAYQRFTQGSGLMQKKSCQDGTLFSYRTTTQTVKTSENTKMTSVTCVACMLIAWPRHNRSVSVLSMHFALIKYWTRDSLGSELRNTHL